MINSKFKFHGARYIIHNETPTFLAEIIEKNGNIDIKPVEFDKIDFSKVGVMQFATLMREMGDWFVENQHLRPKL